MHHLIETGTIAQVKYCLARIGDSKDGSPIFLFGYQMSRSYSNELGDCMLGVGTELALMVSHFLA
jgi:hypothetical protein